MRKSTKLRNNSSIPFGETEDSMVASGTREPSEERVQQIPAQKRVAVDLGFDDRPENAWVRTKRVCSSLLSTFKMFSIFLHLAWIDFKRRTCAFCLGFFSVLVVVMMCVVMLSILSSLPVVFLRLAEGDRGQIDLQLSPGGQMAAASTLNYSAITELFPRGQGATGYHSARITFSAVLLLTSPIEGPGRCAAELTSAELWTDPSSGEYCTDWSCLKSHCGDINGPNVQVVGFDSATEHSMGLGRDARYASPQRGETILSRTVARILDINSGDRITLYGGVGQILQEGFRTSGNVTRDGAFIMSLRVATIIDSDSRKFPVSDDFVLIGYDDVLAMVADALSPAVPADVRNTVAQTPAASCATTVYFNVPPGERDKAYLSTSYSTIRRNIAVWSSNIIGVIGFNQLSSRAPIVNFLYSTRMFSVFVGLIMSIILAALAFLSIVLIYSLLTVSVETRTYEIGLQRMIGFTRENLVFMVLMNAYSFTIPAWLCGLALGQCIYLAVRAIFQKLVDVQMNTAISGSSAGWATLAGLAIPLVAAVFPIHSAVTLTLPQALDSARGRSVGVIYKAERNDAREMNGTMFGLGVLFAVFGFLLYYLFPLSLIMMNLSLMFYIFFAVLIGMLAGLVLLSVNFERVFETVLAYLLLFWENKAVFRMTRKMLSAHRLRNRKTTLMYALSLAFIIFITVAFGIQLLSFTYSTERSLGSEGVISSLYLTFEEYAAFQNYVRLFSNGEVVSMTYRYTPLASLSSNLQSMTLMSAGRYRQASTSLVAIPPDFFEHTFHNYLFVGGYNDDVRDYSLSGAVYARNSMNRYLISTTSWNYLGVRGWDDINTWEMRYRTNLSDATTYSRHIVAQVAAKVDSAPVFSFSKFPGSYGDSLTSIPNMARLFPLPYTSVRSGRISAVQLRLRKNADTESVVGNVGRFFSIRGTYYDSSDVTSSNQDINTAGMILDLFFYFTEIVILIICLFSLMSSMTTNVLESSKEVGILLCLGMSHFQVYRVFVYEAFILVLAAGLLGLAVGIIVAYTMQIQNMLFTQLPMPFSFPYVQLCIVVAMGFLSAVISSFSPVRYLLGLPSITYILRRSFS